MNLSLLLHTTGLPVAQFDGNTATVGRETVLQPCSCNQESSSVARVDHQRAFSETVGNRFDPGNCPRAIGKTFFLPTFHVPFLSLLLSLQSMRTGPDQGQIGPLLRRGFFCRERFARIFCLPRLQFFLVAFLCSRWRKYQVFFQNTLPLSLTTCQTIGFWEIKRQVLASSCSHHSRRAARSSRRTKRGNYSAT